MPDGAYEIELWTGTGLDEPTVLAAGSLGELRAALADWARAQLAACERGPIRCWHQATRLELHGRDGRVRRQRPLRVNDHQFGSRRRRA